MDNSYRIALCQTAVAKDKEQNKQHVSECVAEAAAGGARIICLPEIWNSPYDVKLFGDYAEPDDGPCAQLMSGLAKKHSVYLIGGSIPESAGGAMYNTSMVFAPSGDMVAKHRKTHLFDIDIEGGIRFMESEFFSPGSGPTVFETEFGVIGLAICFDLRFPEMFREMALKGARMVFLPASFNMTTGPAHWDTLIKARALDNQLYLAACSPARDLSASYTSWGHSCVATPWGEYCAATDARQTIIYATIDYDYCQKIRRELPIGF